MFNKKKTAIIVVDILNDFVSGSLGFPGAKEAVMKNQALLKAARKAGVPVIFANDSHYLSDPEIKIWGPHALRGTKGAEVVPELEFSKGDYIVEKRRYSSFCDTEMDSLLRDLKVENVIITGFTTNMCVRHTSADAFQKDYNVYIPKDATATFNPKEQRSALKYLKLLYAAKIYDTEKFIEMLSK